MTTLSKKMLGYALGRTVAGLRSAADRRDDAAGGDASFSDLAMQDRDAAASSATAKGATRRRRRRRSRSRPRRSAVTASRSRQSDEHETFTFHPSRRHFLRGVGVALALPWMESLPLFAQAGRGRAPGEHAAAAVGHHLTSRTASSRSLVGEGQRRGRWSSGPAALPMMPHREDMVFIQGPLQPAGRRLDEPAPRPHEPAVGRAGQPRPERDPRRHVDGPGPRRRRSAAARPSPASCSASSPTSCGSKTACR